MQRWQFAFCAIAVTAVFAAEASATPISNRASQGDGIPPAATDLAAESAWDPRGVPVLGGEVGPARFVEGVEPTAIPEPDTLLLVSLGMFGLVIAGRRRVARV